MVHLGSIIFFLHAFAGIYNKPSNRINIYKKLVKIEHNACLDLVNL